MRSKAAKVWPLPALNAHPKWRERANEQVERARAEKAKAEREAEEWIATVRARKAAK